MIVFKLGFFLYLTCDREANKMWQLEVKSVA